MMRGRFSRGYSRTANFFARHRKTRALAVTLILLGFASMIAYTFVLAAPLDFPDGSLLRIKKGSTISEAAALLEKKHIVNSAFIFEWVVRAREQSGGIVAGEYSFSGRQGLFTIAQRLMKGDFELAPVRIRVQDGMSVRQIADMLRDQLPDFDADGFYALAVSREGRMFPDTYFFLPSAEPAVVADTMEKNFNEHIRDVSVTTAIETFGKPLNQVLTMASLLEREAPDTQDRRIIAGILWHRIQIGMPLQVDAVFPYLIGKNSFNLTRRDLLTDSPYNTYTNKGLPPGPIGNPGIDAILSAVTPVKTTYLYYLSGLDGKMYYSTTYDQHIEKKQKYLD